MSETNLPFNDKFCPNNAQPSSGEKRRQVWEKSINNPKEFWDEKAKAIDWFTPYSKVLDDSNPHSSPASHNPHERRHVRGADAQ